MPRGARTSPELREQAVMLYAKTGSYAATARQIKLAEQTVADVIANSKEFGEYRALVEQGYIVRTWQRIERIEDVLEAKLIDTSSLTDVSVLELVSVIEKLHKTVTNVANHIIAVQAVMVTDSPEDIETAAFGYIAGLAGLSVIEAKKRLGLLQ